MTHVFRKHDFKVLFGGEGIAEDYRLYAPAPPNPNSNPQNPGVFGIEGSYTYYQHSRYEVKPGAVFSPSTVEAVNAVFWPLISVILFITLLLIYWIERAENPRETPSLLPRTTKFTSYQKHKTSE